MTVDADEALYWLWCGTECDGKFIGPHPDPEAAELDASTSGCQHDHVVFQMTLRQMAEKLRHHRLYFHVDGVREDGGDRALVLAGNRWLGSSWQLWCEAQPLLVALVRGET